MNIFKFSIIFMILPICSSAGTEYLQQEYNDKSVNERLQIKETDDCEAELRYFSEMVEEHPNEEYYQFMLRKISQRCLGE